MSTTLTSTTRSMTDSPRPHTWWTRWWRPRPCRGASSRDPPPTPPSQSDSRGRSWSFEAASQQTVQCYLNLFWPHLGNLDDCVDLVVAGDGVQLAVVQCGLDGLAGLQYVAAAHGGALARPRPGLSLHLESDRENLSAWYFTSLNATTKGTADITTITPPPPPICTNTNHSPHKFIICVRIYVWCNVLAKPSWFFTLFWKLCRPFTIPDHFTFQ